MAENKKSFILYSDLLLTVEKLPDDKAGKLFKIILNYVNDNNPEVEDLLLQIAFEPVKQQLKRDLKKWEKYIDKQTINGQKGGRPKNPNKTEKTQALKDKPKKPVNVNANVTESANVSETKKYPSEKEFLDYCKEIPKFDYTGYEFSLKAKYAAWIDNDWKDGNNKPIKNWKSKILNTIPFLKPQGNNLFSQNAKTSSSKDITDGPDYLKK